MLFSAGDALTPGGGSSCSLKTQEQTQYTTHSLFSGDGEDLITVTVHRETAMMLNDKH